MKRNFFIASACLILGSLQMNNSIAQSGQWIWVKGDSINNATPVFGTMGVTDSLNTPGGVYGPAEWTDKQGNLWIFGGFGSTGIESAMWKYNPSINQWTWVRGSQSCCDTGVYGIKGLPSVSNYPGSRGYGSATWVDTSGNFWLFGGFGFDGYGNSYILNDLWRYNPSTDEWTWMKGSDLTDQPGVYGTQGVADSANTPGAREETTANWVDQQNNLWLYGGLFAPDDLWKYNIANNEWTWVKGFNSGTSIVPVYGTLGIPSNSNTPGTRYIYAKWIDAQDNLWLFGGFANATSSARNDLWKYDPLINEWMWMNGPNTGNDNGIYNNYCSPDSAGHPRARLENRAAWTDTDGKFWMMGGWVDFAINTINDMWYYTPATDEWTWVSGNTVQNYAGLYGVQGVPNPYNDPPARGGAVSWIDDQCQLWLFGGWSNNQLARKNDVWKFIPDNACGGCLSSALSASDTSICEKFCIDFADQSTNNPTAWQWIFPGGSPDTSTMQNPSSVCYNTTGTFDVTLITYNASGNDTLVLNNFITVYPTPLFPVISVSGDTLTSSAATGYQWQFNTIPIPGATNQSYTVTQSGLYTVVVTDENGCSSSADYLFTGEENLDSNWNVLVYPNPSGGIFNVEYVLSAGDNVMIKISDAIGQLVYTEEEKNVSGVVKKQIDLSNLAAAVYVIKLKTHDQLYQQKIFIR